MKNWLASLIFAAVVAPLASCALYAGDSGGGGGSGSGSGIGSGCIEASITMRDPDTGICGTYSSDDGECGVDPGVVHPVAVPALPNWPACNTQCDSLNAVSCEATPGCHAYFVDSNPNAFITCGSVGVSTTTTHPSTASAVECVALDADTCANADGCISLLALVDTDGADDPYWFASCAVETPTTTCHTDSDCSPGFECELDSTECPQDQTCPPGDVECSCPGTCVAGGTPLPVACASVTSEAACDARIDCMPVYEGTGCTCDNNQTCNCPVTIYTGCQDNPLDTNALTVVTPQGNVGRLDSGSSTWAAN